MPRRTSAPRWCGWFRSSAGLQACRGVAGLKACTTSDGTLERVRVRAVRQIKAIAGHEIPGPAGRQLDRRVRAKRRRHAPGLQALHDLPDTARLVDEHHVEREPHERGVHGGARREHQGRRGVEAVAPEQAPPAIDARHGDLDDAGDGGVCAFVDELHARPCPGAGHQKTPGTRCHSTRRQYAWYSASPLSTRSSISARRMSAVSAIADDDGVPPARVRDQEREVRDEVSAVDGMPDQRVGPANHDAAVGGHQAEAPAERQLAEHHEREPERRGRGGDHVGDKPAGIGRQKQRRADHGDGRHHRRAHRPIDDVRGTPDDRQHDHERFAHEQQQAGDTARAQEVLQDVDGQQREQHADRRPRQELGGVAARAFHQ